MNTSPIPRHVLVLKSDMLCAAALSLGASRSFASAKVSVATKVCDAIHLLSNEPVDLMMSGIHLRDGNSLEFVRECTQKVRRVERILIVTGRKDARLLTTLRVLPIGGVFDPDSEGLPELEGALRTVMNGRAYWSRAVIERLSAEGAAPAHCRLLSPTEQLVFAMIGDGCDDSTAGRHLDRSAATVQTVRRALHTKLCVQHKGDLVRLAVQYGFVEFTPDGVCRPGLASLLEACKRRRNIPKVASAFAARACAHLEVN